MCLSCGCMKPEDDHDQYGSITIQRLYDAAKSAGIDVGDVVNNIENTFANRVAGMKFDDVDTGRDNDDDEDN